MKRSMRLLMLVAVAALAGLAVANVGVANPHSPMPRKAPDCTANLAPSFPCAVAGKIASSADELLRICSENLKACGIDPNEEIKPCKSGVKPTLEKPCLPKIDWANLAECAAGQRPSSTAPCKFDLPDCAEGQKPSMGSPCMPKPCPPGAKPTKNAPCVPEGQDGGFDAPPTTDIRKQLNNKFMVIKMDVEGSGDADGSFDVIFRSVVDGVNKQTKAFLNDQLEGESFIINTTATTKCFADTTDPDKIPDLVSCNELDDAANNAPGSIKAQFRGKVTFDDKTFLPTFKAQKIVFLKGVFNVAKIK